MIQQGANINERNVMGATGLIYAIQFNQKEIAKLLIENGADTTIKDKKGNTAMDHARTQGIPELIALLQN